MRIRSSQVPRAAADHRRVSRTFSIVSILAAVAVGGFMLTAQAAQRAHDRHKDHAAVSEATANGYEANVQQAALALLAQQVDTGSFAGTDLRAYPGVELVRADSSSYCIQMGSGDTELHLEGPSGATAPGGC